MPVGVKPAKTDPRSGHGPRQVVLTTNDDRRRNRSPHAKLVRASRRLGLSNVRRNPILPPLTMTFAPHQRKN